MKSRHDMAHKPVPSITDLGLGFARNIGKTAPREEYFRELVLPDIFLNPDPNWGFFATKRQVLAVIGSNKPLAYGTQVRMADGSAKAIEDIVQGDRVLAWDGEKSVPTDVLAIPFDDVEEAYRVTTKTGLTVEATADHPFPSILSRVTGVRPRTVAQLARAKAPTKKFVCSGPQCFDGGQPPFSGLLLGLFLGDGCYGVRKTKPHKGKVHKYAIVNFANQDGHYKDLFEREVVSCYPRLHINRFRSSPDQIYVAGPPGRNQNDFVKDLRRLGLDVKAHEKFIPEVFKRASVNTRRDIIRGLVMTDGSVDDRKTSIHSCSKRLLLDAQDLIVSLGGTCRIYARKKRESLFHHQCYKLQLSNVILKDIGCSDLGRKTPNVASCIIPQRADLIIASVEAIGLRNCRCLTIKHPSHMFVLANGIVTCNSWKSRVNVYLCVMIYSGIIPDCVKGLYAHEELLRSISPGGENHRPRHVQIVVQDFAKHWPKTIRPMLLGDPEKGGIGMLPEDWSAYDDESHMFNGPDGSWLSIDAADPQVSSEPKQLRGPFVDHSYIDENNRQSVFSECKTRSSGAPNSMRTVALGFCPQDGYQDWTYSQLYGACYDLQTDKRLPPDKQNPGIFSIRVSMRDNPDITPEEIRSHELSIPQHQVAYRVHGMYSAEATHAYFDFDILDHWRQNADLRPGHPFIVKEAHVDTEAGVYEGELVPLQERDILAGGDHDEKHTPIWWLWELPADGEKYIIPADTAAGDPNSDFQSADILRCTKPEETIQVGFLHMRLLKPGEFGVQCACMGNIFGDCMIAPEDNETGRVFIDRIRTYSNLYVRTVTGQTEEKQTKRLGWHTDRWTKPVLLETLYKSFRKMFTKDHCPIRSRTTLNEMMSYEQRSVQDKDGNYTKTEYGAKIGQHDDTVMSFAIGNRIIQHEHGKISACRIRKPVVPPFVDKHDLGRSQLTRTKAFSNWKKQPKLSKLQRNFPGGSTHARRHRH